MVDWPTLVSTIASAAPLWLVLAAAAILVARFLITLRWRILLRLAGNQTPWWQLFGIVSAGIGVGSLLPTSAGPDIMRGAMLARHEHGSTGEAKLTRVVGSLLLDRSAAMLGTFGVALAAAAAAGLWPLAGGLAAFLGAVVALALLALKLSASRVKQLFRGRLAQFGGKVGIALDRVKEPGVLGIHLPAAVAVSMLMTIVRTAMFVCLYRAFGHAVPLGLALVLIPLLLIALITPISIGGLGLREWVLVIGFEGAGVPAEVSVSVGIVSFALQLIVSLPWVVGQAVHLPARPARVRGADGT